MAHHQQDKPIAAGKSSFQIIDPKILFNELELESHETVLDLACGGGAYSLAASSRLKAGGLIHAMDLWDEGIATLRQAIDRQGISNIKPILGDVSKEIPLADGSVDLCLMATVLHDLVEDHTEKGTLQEAARVLRPKGMLAVIEFKKMAGKPGPPIHIRLNPEQTRNLVEPYGFTAGRLIDIGQFTYMMIFTRNAG